jgi:hypothetical protein
LRWLAALALVASGWGCGGGSQPGADGAIDGAIDAAPPPWWQPRIGEARNWDIQLAAPIDVSAVRAMYDLELWALVPSPTVLDYGDGAPVTVPAGSLAGTIAMLHGRSPRAVVICHVETGALELDRPDAAKFPGYDADPSKIPNNPTPPSPGSVIGWSVASPAKRWLDIREASRSRWISIMFKRFDLARQIGCDGVEPERNQNAQFTTGFPITGADSYSWYDEIARQGHQRMLSTGMKNGTSLAGQVDHTAAEFDWLMIERCGEDDDCDSTRPFVNLQKPVFAIDYDTDLQGAPLPAATLCGRQQTAQIVDGLIKDTALTRTVRTPCSP